MTWVYPLDHPHDRSLPELTALLGGKAANLWVMSHELGLPVPPGIAISTEACQAYLRSGWPTGLDEELRAGVTGIASAVGRGFGDPSDPLLVSVRSGAPVSMPGMMDTILDVGLTASGVAGLARVSRNPEFAADCRQRLEAMFRSTVGHPAPDDPWAQLRLATEAVFRSWNSDRAVAYRRHENIPDDTGTGVTVQAMVFGNRAPDSGTGVVFTRNPATGEAGLYGDVLFGGQGEDVVAGTHRTQPISALDERLPAVGAQLREAADRLERHFADLCDMEFTIEDGRLWLLQVRVGKRTPRAAVRIALEMANDPAFPLTREAAVRRVASILASPPTAAASVPATTPVLTEGLGASPGLAAGEIATTPEEAIGIADRGGSAILVRAETSPEDVHGMARAAGILTATGGLASHAAVVARGWGIPAVVGAATLRVDGGGIAIGDERLGRGEIVTIDGDRGRVFRGHVVSQAEVIPEARELLRWASELGIGIGPQPAAEDEDGVSVARRRALGRAHPIPTGTATADASQDAAILVVGAKGFATRDAVAGVLGRPPEAIQSILDRLVEEGRMRTSAGAFRLTDAGQEHRLALQAAERSAVGEAATAAALDAFLAIDRAVKAAVTDWQVRTTAGEPVANDHSDERYDELVLAELRSAHVRALAWIDDLATRWPRVASYRARLQGAIAAVDAGDTRFVASPRVDSYHAVWFELHEDLIGLSGRTRASEVAAGRA